MKLSTLVLAPLALVPALVLAIANRGPIRFSLDPFSLEAPMVAFEIPLFILLFVALLLGVLIGGSSAWAGQTTWRKKARKSGRDVKHLEKDLARQKADASPDKALKTEPGKQASPARDQRQLPGVKTS